MYASSKNANISPVDIFLSKAAIASMLQCIQVLQYVPLEVFDAELRVLDALEKECETPAERDGVEAMRRMVNATKQMRQVMENEGDVIGDLYDKIVKGK